MKIQLFLLSVITTSISSAQVFAAIEATPNSLMVVKTQYGQSKNSKSISSQQAARIVQSKYGGKVLKVKSSGSKSKPSYRVKLLKDNGHVISVNVDGQSGQVSGN